MTGVSFPGPLRTRRGFVIESTLGPKFEPFCFTRQGTQNALSDRLRPASPKNGMLRSGTLRCCQQSRKGCCSPGQNEPPTRQPRLPSPGRSGGPRASCSAGVVHGVETEPSRLSRCEDALLFVSVPPFPSLFSFSFFQTGACRRSPWGAPCGFQRVGE